MCAARGRCSERQTGVGGIHSETLRAPSSVCCQEGNVMSPFYFSVTLEKWEKGNLLARNLWFLPHSVLSTCNYSKFRVIHGNRFVAVLYGVAKAKLKCPCLEMDYFLNVVSSKYMPMSTVHPCPHFKWQSCIFVQFGTKLLHKRILGHVRNKMLPTCVSTQWAQIYSQRNSTRLAIKKQKDAQRYKLWLLFIIDEALIMHSIR